MSIIEKIKQLRSIKGLTQQNISDYLNMDQPTYSAIEKNKREITIDDVKLLSKLFNVSTDYLLGLEEIDKPNKVIDDLISIPILGSVACGLPLFVEQNIEDNIILPVKYFPSSHQYFCLKAKGDSMINANIFDGNLLFFKQQNTIDANGDIMAVCNIDNEATVKRVYKNNDYIELRPENPTHSSTRIEGKGISNILILGKLIGVYSSTQL